VAESKLLDIAEEIKKLSTSGNVIQVDEYKNGKKVEKQRQLGRLGREKKKLPIYVITSGSTNGYKIILTKPKKKNKDYSNQ